VTKPASALLVCIESKRATGRIAAKGHKENYQHATERCDEKKIVRIIVRLSHWRKCSQPRVTDVPRTAIDRVSYDDDSIEDFYWVFVKKLPKGLSGKTD